MTQEVKKGDLVTIRSTYSVRGYILGPDEQVSQDAREFDKNSHPPKLVTLTKQESCLVLAASSGGEVLVRVERDGTEFACFLLADSFDVTRK